MLYERKPVSMDLPTQMVEYISKGAWFNGALAKIGGYGPEEFIKAKVAPNVLVNIRHEESYTVKFINEDKPDESVEVGVLCLNSIPRCKDNLKFQRLEGIYRAAFSTPSSDPDGWSAKGSGCLECFYKGNRISSLPENNGVHMGLLKVYDYEYKDSCEDIIASVALNGSGERDCHYFPNSRKGLYKAMRDLSWRGCL